MKKSFKSLENTIKSLKFVFKLEIMPKNELVEITCTGLQSQLRDWLGFVVDPVIQAISQEPDRPRGS